MAKRLLSMVLVLALVVSLMPNVAIGVSAEGLNGHTDHTGWTEWTDATKLPNKAGQYYLSVDVNLTAAWSVPGKTHLCLNGHTITQTASTRVISVGASAELSIYDCAATQGKITGGKHKFGAGVWVERGGGVFNLYGGNITENRLSGSDNDSGVYLQSSQKEGSKAGGVFNMYGGTISGNGTSGKTNGGGVYLHAEGTAANRYPSKPATFNMYGGTISGNKGLNGGGVSARGDAVINIYGGNITGNKATNAGGAIYSQNSTKVLIKDAKITGNTTDSKSTDGYGSAVYICNMAVLTLSGKPTIADNTNGSGVDLTINVTTGEKLRVNELTGGSVVYANKDITTGTAAADAFAIADGGTQTATFRGVIQVKVGDETKYLGHENNAFTFIDGHFHGSQEYTEWTKTDALPSSGYYYLASDVTIKNTDNRALIDGGKTLHLCVNGKTVSLEENVAASQQSELIRVADGKLYLDDCTTVYDADGYFVSGGKLTDGKKKGQGAAVYINNAESVFVATGIEFSGNKDTETSGDGYGGGAVQARNNTVPAKFIGCKFSGNKTAGTGGALCVRASGKVYAEKTVFENNTATKTGGAIFVTGGALELKDCKLTGNTAANASAIQIIGTSTVTITDTTITGGTSSNGYGAVNYGNANSTLKLQGKTVIDGNKGKGDVQQNLHLQNVNGGVDVSGLTSGAKVGVSLLQERIEAGRMFFSTAMTTNPGYCVSDDENYKVDLVEGKLALVETVVTPPEPDHEHKLCNDASCTAHGDAVKFEKWTATDKLPESGDWYLENNVKVTAQTKTTGDLNLCLNGKTITKTGSGRVYEIPNGKKLSITDCSKTTVGTITGGASNYGSSVCVNDGAEFNLYAGKITKGRPAQTDLSKGASGAAIYLRSADATGATFNMYGGEITDNGAANSWGGAVTNASGNADNTVYVNIYGGKIYNNEALMGGAIRLAKNAVLHISGGEITGNTATTGGAVYAEKTVKVYISGEPVVYDNLSGTAQNNLHLLGDGKLTLGTLGSKAKLGVTAEEAPRFISNTSETDYTGNVLSDSAEYMIERRENALYMDVFSTHPKHCLCTTGTVTGCDHSGKTWKAWDKTDSLPTSGTIYLTDDVNLEAAVSVSGTLNVCLNGYTVKAPAGKRIAYVSAGSVLNITDCAQAAGSLTGGTSIWGAAVNVTAGATFNLWNGKITDNKNTAADGGVGAVYLAAATKDTSGGVFHMYGGEISGNTGSLGAIYMPSSPEGTKVSQFHMYGGIIANNQAVSYTYQDDDGKDAVGGGNGGAINAGKANILLSGGKITGNTADRNGGGVYVNGKAQLTIANTEISGNTAVEFGGGVFATSNGTVITMNGGTFSGNTAKAGGGVMLQTRSKMILNGGSITANVGGSSGGAGVYVSTNTEFEMNGGQITANKSSSNGGGIAALRSVVTLNKGTVANNTATRYGGGIYASGVELNMKNVSVQNNTAELDGGGVFITYTSAKQSDGTNKEYTANVTINDGAAITGNKAKGNGGGLVASRAALTMLGGQISKNRSEKAAGGILLQSKTEMTMTGGKVQGNTAKDGGGIYVSTNTKFNMEGGSVSGNTAQMCAGVYFLRSEGKLSGGSISGNHATHVITYKDGKETKSRGDAGGVYARGAKVTVSGTAITNNIADNNGGGMITGVVTSKGVRYTSTVTITGGSLSGNKATHGGGMLLQSTGSVLNVHGGLISGNHVTKGGGGLYISTKTKLTMTGGRIVNNTSESNGAGIYLLKTESTITGGEISGNKAVTNSGNMMVNGDTCVVNVKGIKIHGGEANTAGGIVIQSKGTLNMTDCEIYNNKSLVSHGGAVFVSNNSFGNFTNCKFYSNESTKHGGAVLVNNFANASFIGCDFTDNKANQQGGAVWCSVASNTDIEKCTFSKNAAEGRGGAIVCKGNMNMKDTLIENNVSKVSGGGIQTDYATTTGSGIMKGLVMENTIIRNNVAESEVGGGIHINKGTSVKIYNSEISGNKSALEGGGIWAYEDLELYDTTITGNTSGGAGYALYYNDANYDGHSYFTSRNRMGGNVIVKDNNNGDMYMGPDVVIVIPETGLGDKAHIELTLDSGVVTNRILGPYHYEGGDQVYTVTAGDRSITDPEYDASLNAADGQSDGNAFVWVYIGGGVAVAAIAAAVVLLLLKKKKAGKTAAEANQE